MTQLDISWKHNVDATKAWKAPLRLERDQRVMGGRQKGRLWGGGRGGPAGRQTSTQPNREQREKLTCCSEAVNKANSQELGEGASVTGASLFLLKKSACLESRGRGSK